MEDGARCGACGHERVLPPVVVAAYGWAMRPVELMTIEQLVAEAKALQRLYEARLARASDTLGGPTVGDMDEDLSRYFEVRSELQRRGDGPPLDGIPLGPPDGAG